MSLTNEQINKEIEEIAEKNTIRDNKGNFITFDYLNHSKELLNWFKEQLIEDIQEMKKLHKNKHFGDNNGYFNIQGYNQALSDLQSKLKDQSLLDNK